MSTPMEFLEFNQIDPIKLIYHRPIGKKYVVPHWHEAVEITYVEKGYPGDIYIEDNRYSLKQGDIYIINSRLIHGFDSVITKNDRILTLLLNYEWLRKCLPETMATKSFALIRSPQNKQQRSSFNALVKLIEELNTYAQQVNSDRNHLMKLNLEIRIISILVNDFTVERTIKTNIPEVIAEIIKDFHDNYQDEIHLSNLASQYNYSYAYFSKLFKKYLGVAPKKYLTLLRVQKAAELIEQTNDNFNKIAFDTGFPDEKSFYMSFKERYKQTPLQHRKKTHKIIGIK